MHDPGDEIRFYFTVHPGDLIRARLIKNAHIMTVAAAHWDNDKKRFKIVRPPADHIASLAIDSGGFTAARRWGKYPWTPAQYAEFIHKMSRDIPLDFCAIMDYACEPTVNRDIYPTNRDRIEATLDNEESCIAADPTLPWLPVLQGDNLAERTYDLTRRRERNHPPGPFVGLGSICGRGVIPAIETILFYKKHLPQTRFHAFGLHIQALDDPAVHVAIRSWDSYSWNWGKGQKDVDRPPEYLKQPDETRSQHAARLARLYYTNTVKPRLKSPAQLSFI